MRLNARVFRCERVFGLLWFFAILLLSSVSNAVAADLETGVVDFMSGWEFQFASPGDKPETTLARISANDTWRSMERVGPPPNWNKRDDLWERVRLSSDDLNGLMDPVLAITVIDQATEVYSSGKLIYRYSEILPGGGAKFQGYPVHFVPLRDVVPGSWIYFRVASSHNNIGIGGNVFLGSRAAILRKIFVGEQLALAVGSVLCVVGLFMLLVFVMNRNDKVAFGYGSFLLLMGIYILVTSWSVRMQIGSELFRINVELASLYFSSAAFGFFCDAVFRGVDRFRILRFFVATLLFFVLLTTVSAVLGFFSLMSVLFYWQMLGLVAMIVFVAVPLSQVHRGNVEAIYFLLGVASFVGGAITGVLSALNKVPRSWGAYSVLCGAAAMGTMMGLIVVRRYRLMNRQVHEYAKELEVKNEELAVLDKLKDQFLANTSHELRTPLVGILGIAESLIDGAVGHLSEEVKKNLALIVYSGRRLSSLINDILDFSKLKKHHFDLSIEPNDLGKVVEVVLLNSSMLLGKREIALSSALPPNLSPVLADGDRLQQVLYNLVGNAIKFTESGSITVRAEENETEVVVCVEDTGIGISPEHHDKLFVAFQQGDSSTTRRFGGTGLGLSVSKQIVELHGGRIWFESEVGKGSKFRFSLPKTSEPPRSDNERVTVGRRIDDVAIDETGLSETHHSLLGADKGHVLVVDDEPVNRQVLTNVLTQVGFEVTEAESGAEALKLIREGKVPEVILLDVMMPQMSGYEVCQALRKDHSMDNLPIIFLTAKNQLSNLVEGFVLGGNDYLTKPFFKNELLARIKVQLELVRATRMLRTANAQMHELLVATRDMALRSERLGIVQRGVEAMLARVETPPNLAIDISLLVRNPAAALLVRTQRAYVSHMGDEKFDWVVSPEVTEQLFSASFILPTKTKVSACEAHDNCLVMTAFYGDQFKTMVKLERVGAALLAPENLQFCDVIAESLAVILASLDFRDQMREEEHKRHDEEVRSLRRVVGIAARVSDRLNSPLLVLLNGLELMSKRFHHAFDKHDSDLPPEIGTFAAEWHASNEGLRGALAQLKELSKQLAETREEGGKIEATEAMGERL